MKQVLFFIGSILFFISCTEKLDERVIENLDVKISWYRESEITSAHDFIDVIKDNQTIQILKANENGIVNVIIKKDSIIIKTKPSLIFYEFKEKAFNYNVKIDSTATHEEWIESMKKYGLWFKKDNK